MTDDVPRSTPTGGIGRRYRSGSAASATRAATGSQLFASPTFRRGQPRHTDNNQPTPRWRSGCRFAEWPQWGWVWFGATAIAHAPAGITGLESVKLATRRTTIRIAGTASIATGFTYAILLVVARTSSLLLSFQF